jgi:hypothetical protein
MPESTREGEALSAFFGQWGEVVHCAVVLNYREPILASRHRAACREALHHRQVEWYLAKANAYPEKRRKKAAAHVAFAKHQLYKADQITKQIAAAPHHCCGHVFVTFDTVEAAQACIEAARSGHKYFQGFGPLEMRAAPEAEDVIWENLQCSRWERGFRSLAALLAALAAVTASTAAITYSSLQQTSLMCRSAAAVTTRPRLQPWLSEGRHCVRPNLNPNPNPNHNPNPKPHHNPNPKPHPGGSSSRAGRVRPPSTSSCTTT